MENLVLRRAVVGRLVRRPYAGPALSLSDDPLRDETRHHLAVVGFSIVVQGLTMPLLLRALGFVPGRP
jgi:hypothetical protein